MLEQTGASIHAGLARESERPQPAYLTSYRTIRLPFPIGEVRETLASVFAAPVVIEKGRFAAREEYTGRIDGHDVVMRVVWSHHTSGRRRFLVRGRLRDDPPGTTMEMAITSLCMHVKWWFYVLLPIIVICVGKGYRDGLSGRELLLAAGFVVAVLYGLAMPLYYLALSLWRRHASKKVGAFLMKGLAGRAGRRQQR